jgi:hypothetical protein
LVNKEGKMLGPAVPADRMLDQASRLREMAGPLTPPISPDAVKALASTKNSSLMSPQPTLLDPHVVLISEYPILQGGFELAWRLAQQYGRLGRRTAIVDLSPSASRLPAELGRLHETQADAALTRRQSLWIHTPHGRVLTPWSDVYAQDATDCNAIDIIAQPVGEYPTAEQLPRIYEQFLRAVGSGRRGNQPAAAKWNTIVLLSEAHGIPLDAACWQAADEILFALPHSTGYLDEARAALSARLSAATGVQRRVALWKQEGLLSNWAIRRWARMTEIDHSMTLPGFDDRPIVWPHQSHSLFSAQRQRQPAFSRAARKLVGELSRLTL